MLAKTLGAIAFTIFTSFMSFSSVASITNSSATLTADNEFWLYSGNATGSNLSFIGHGNNWPTAYSFNFDVDPGDYLYVMALDWGQPHSWQGAFSTPSGSLYTNMTDWVAKAVSSTTVDSSVITTGAWSTITQDQAYNVSPWGAVVNDPNAHWIWKSGTNDSETMVLFRSAAVVSSVPEPETYAMLLAGLGLLGFMTRRKKETAV